MRITFAVLSVLLLAVAVARAQPAPVKEPVEQGIPIPLASGGDTSGAQPVKPDVFQSVKPKSYEGNPTDYLWIVLGLKVEKATKDLKVWRGGVTVIDVRGDGPAGAVFQRGDIIVGLDVWETLDAQACAYVLSHRQKQGSESVKYHVVRNAKLLSGSTALRFPQTVDPKIELSPSKGARVRRLLEERLVILKELDYATEKAFQANKATFAELMEAKALLLGAELALCEGDQERLKVHEKSVAFAREFEQRALQLHRKGMLARTAAMLATSKRLEAEIALERTLNGTSNRPISPPEIEKPLPMRSGDDPLIDEEKKNKPDLGPKKGTTRDDPLTDVEKKNKPDLGPKETENKNDAFLGPKKGTRDDAFTDVAKKKESDKRNKPDNPLPGETEKKKAVTYPIELEKKKSDPFPIELEKKKSDPFPIETPKEDGRKKPAAKHDFSNLQRLATALENYNYPENSATRITVWCQGGGKGNSVQVTDAKTLDVATACHYIVDGHHDKKGLDLENVAIMGADGQTIRFVNIKEKFAANKPFGLNVNRGELVIVLQLRFPAGGKPGGPNAPEDNPLRPGSGVGGKPGGPNAPEDNPIRPGPEGSDSKAGGPDSPKNNPLSPRADGKEKPGVLYPPKNYPLRPGAGGEENPGVLYPPKNYPLRPGVGGGRQLGVENEQVFRISSAEHLKLDPVLSQLASGKLKSETQTGGSAKNAKDAPPKQEPDWDLTPPTKEPKYQNEPRYALLVFGPKHEQRIWMVLDGTTLYVDRNGNGDLTEPGERLEPNNPKDGSNRFAGPSSHTHFDVYEFTVEAGAMGKAKFRLNHWVRDEGFTPKTDFDKHLHANWLKLRWENSTLFRTEGLGQGQTPVYFMPKPADAHVCALDGPLTFMVKAPEHQVLRRGEAGCDLAFCIAVLGRSPRGIEQRFCNPLATTELPAGAHLEVEIEYPAKAANAAPLRRKYLLKERC
jgi:hypothetical protein